MARLRVVLVVVCPAVVAELVNVREVGQAVRVHHGEAVLRETGGGVAHRKSSCSGRVEERETRDEA